MRPSAMTTSALALCTACLAWPHLGFAQTLTTATSEDYGEYLVGPTDLPVYAFLTSVEIGGDGEDPIDSCNVEKCRADWPLVTVGSEVTVGEGLDPELTGTREVDGVTVLLYGGHPLFYFVRDAPGEPPQGQGIFSYGGYWALLAPSGEFIRTGPMDEIDGSRLMPTD